MRNQCVFVLTILVLLFGFTQTSFATTVSFQGLGDLPGGGFSSFAFGVSADGSVVVGDSLPAWGSEAFRWTSGGGMVGLGNLPGGDFEAWRSTVPEPVTVALLGLGSLLSLLCRRRK